jgi:hypothetical protein
MADSTIPLGESPQKDMTRAERDPKKRTMKGKGRLRKVMGREWRGE